MWQYIIHRFLFLLARLSKSHFAYLASGIRSHSLMLFLRDLSVVPCTENPIKKLFKLRIYAIKILARFLTLLSSFDANRELQTILRKFNCISFSSGSRFSHFLVRSYTVCYLCTRFSTCIKPSSPLRGFPIMLVCALTRFLPLLR